MSNNLRNIGLAAILAASLLAGYLLSRSQEPDRGDAARALTRAANSAVASAAAASADFALPDIDGRLRRLSDWQGRIRIVNFWATWCVPCRREIPLLKEIQASQSGTGIQVIGVAVDELEPVIAYAADVQFNYPILVGGEAAIEAAEGFGIDFMAMPLTFIIAADGELLNAHVGEFKQSDADKALPIITRLRSGEIDNVTARSELAEL